MSCPIIWLTFVLSILVRLSAPQSSYTDTTLGCHKAPDQRAHLVGNASFYETVIQVDGRYRRFRVLPSLSSNAPLILGYHGCGSNLTKFEGEAQFFEHGRLSNVNMIAPLGLNMQPFNPERKKISLGKRAVH